MNILENIDTISIMIFGLFALKLNTMLIVEDNFSSLTFQFQINVLQTSRIFSTYKLRSQLVRLFANNI